jgi:hypothetical protein
MNNIFLFTDAGRHFSNYQQLISLCVTLPIPVAARSKAWVCGRACWDCEFESRRGHGCLSFVSVLCCQIDSASDWPLVQKSPTKCGVSECDCEASIMRRPWPTRGCCVIEKKKRNYNKRGNVHYV